MIWRRLCCEWKNCWKAPFLLCDFLDEISESYSPEQGSTDLSLFCYVTNRLFIPCCLLVCSLWFWISISFLRLPETIPKYKFGWLYEDTLRKQIFKPIAMTKKTFLATSKSNLHKQPNVSLRYHPDKFMQFFIIFCKLNFICRTFATVNRTKKRRTTKKHMDLGNWCLCNQPQ